MSTPRIDPTVRDPNFPEPPLPEPTVEAARLDTPDAQWALNGYLAELADRFPEGFDPGRAAPPNPDDFEPPAGRFLLVRDQGRVRGCGAVRALEPGIAEIRRMWIDPRIRGRGAGRVLLERLEEVAREQGADRVRLDTAAELVEAKGLYVSAGYREIEPYNDNPYARHWFEKVL